MKETGVVSSGVRPSLQSETYVPQVMPRVLGSVGFLSLCVINVFWPSNVTLITGGGIAALSYWVICTLSFFVPCCVVTAQLGALLPHTGSIYNWTYHALGRRWSFFVGVCAWLPNILSLINAVVAFISVLQVLNPSWLVPAWQQGLVVMALLLFSSFLAAKRLQLIQNLMNVAVFGMLLSTLLMGLATVMWWRDGHTLATSFEGVSSWAISGEKNFLFGSVNLALLGTYMPLAMSGEVKQPQSMTRSLCWGFVVTVAGYLVMTVALLVIQGAATAQQTFNPMLLLIATGDRVFGKLVGNIIAIALMLYFLLIPVVVQAVSSRFLYAAAVDQQISSKFTVLNRHRAPKNAIILQTILALLFAGLIFFLAPLLTPLGKPEELPALFSSIIGASVVLIWMVSFFFLFVDLAVLLRVRGRKQYWLLPPPLLVVCVVSGALMCLVTVISTLWFPWLSSLSQIVWFSSVGLLAAVGITCCALGGMFIVSEARWESYQEEMYIRTSLHERRN